MSFKLENFVAAPSMELLNLTKKTKLLNIADHYALTSVKHCMLKYGIKNILIKFLVNEENLDPSALSSVLITQLTYKNIGYNINVLQQTACLVVNPIKVNSFAYLFSCTTVGRTSD